MPELKPKGTMILVGGAEDKGLDEKTKGSAGDEHKPMEILRAMVPANRRIPKIEIITTASSIPNEISKIYRRAFRKIGVKKVGFINLGNYPNTVKPSVMERIKKADTILFSGGDQFRLSTILGNTPVLEMIKKRYYEDPRFTVAGTSAGAMALSSLMIFESGYRDSLVKGEVRISSGMGLLNACIIDTHLRKRGRFSRLAQAVVMNPTYVGIGIGEDTGLRIKSGNEMICIGSGVVIIIDGKEVGHTNISYARENTPIFVEGLRVHILSKGNGFLLRERSFIASKKDLKLEKDLSMRTKKSTGVFRKLSNNR